MSAFRDRITKEKPRIQNVVSRGRCRLRKTEKIFSAHNELGIMKCREKWFPEKLRKIFDLENVQSESFLIRTSKGRAPASELVLLRGGLPSETALQGESLESKVVYRGVGADFKKTKNTFSAHNEQGNMKRGEKWFPEKL